MASVPGSDIEMPLPSEALKYIINHVILPPKLPQEDDYTAQYELWLLLTIIHNLSAFKKIVSEQQAQIVDSAILSMELLRKIHNFTRTSRYVSINEDKLVEILHELPSSGAPVPLHIGAQNAGIILTKMDESVYFELFELSPLNRAVMGTEGRLRRTFPGHAIALPLKTLHHHDLQHTIASTLAKMSHQRAYGTMEQVKKKGQMHDEDRDTTDPKMVSQLFSAFLKSIGQSTKVPETHKNTRDEVLWQNCRLPWHRSPIWLLIRVVLQSYFARQKLHDDLFCISAKLSRRCLKLNSQARPAVLQSAWGVIQDTEDFLQERWSQIQQKNSRSHDFAALQGLLAQNDTAMDLGDLDRFIDGIAKRAHFNDPFKFSKTCPIRMYGISPLDSFQACAAETPTTFRLIQLESWVASNLDSWVVTHAVDSDTCCDLRALIQQYHSEAVTHYQGNPEAMSIMLLTIMELWVAMDKAAVKSCRILGEYRPDLPLQLVENLLLPQKCQMTRLRLVEDYVRGRMNRAVLPYRYIFEVFGQDQCLPVRYFDFSSELAMLRNTIQTEAAQLRQEKRLELAEKQEEYRRLMRMHEESQCEYTSVLNRWTGCYRERHSYSCRKCYYKDSAELLEIEIYEWPLPREENEAKAVVFELQVPAPFGHWRECTAFILTDVLGQKYAVEREARNEYTPQKYIGLCSYFKPFGFQQISLLSEIKPHIVTHRRLRDIITVSDADICLENALAYEYYDLRHDNYVRTLDATSKVPDTCTYQVPAQSLSLQQFLNRTADQPSGPCPNRVLSTQSECPQHLNLDEYKSLASIPLGFRIQWQNILLLLASPVIDFSTDDAGLIISQCNLQTGPAGCGNILRDTHLILDDEEFTCTLLNEIAVSCRAIRENWQSANSLSIFISLLNRVLSLASSSAIKQRTLDILADARATSTHWVDILREKAHRAVESQAREAFLSKAVTAALICLDTFNMEEELLSRVLSAPDQATIMVKSAIIVHEGLYTFKKEHPLLVYLLRLRWERISFRNVTTLVREIVIAKNPALDNAIELVWSTYRPGGHWQALEEPYHHWLSTQTMPDKDGNSLTVHVSLLTGELLVNSLPLNRLPSEYEKDGVYSTLFGLSAIEVMPSSVRGMKFSGKQKFAEHELHFGMGTSADTLPRSCMLIQATYQGSTFELVPDCTLSGHFPVYFTEEFVHWYNAEEQYIEFCPNDRAWLHSNENWRLSRDGKTQKWRLTKGGEYLVSIKSQSAVRLSKIFAPLEDASYIHITLNSTADLLNIDLPRIQLGFWLQLGSTSLCSRQFRGMYVDEYQGIGTLSGLQNMIVLKGKLASQRRKIIIPNGNVFFKRFNDHVCVTLDKSSATKVEAYEIDQLLGRLVDNGSMQSKLFLCQLHALTSFCLSDPLTGMSGTEAALTILRSAAVRSFGQLSQENSDTLSKIASLTPERSFYPEDKREMQCVKWSSSLGFLAQHSAFYETVYRIFEHAKRSELFYPEAEVTLPSLLSQCNDLLRRERLRSATFRNSGFGAECHHNNKHDVVYMSRDQERNSEEAKWAFSFCKMVLHEKFQLNATVANELESAIWSFLLDQEVTLESSPASSVQEFEYNATLLLNSNGYMAEAFVRHHKALSQRQLRPNRFQMMMWLSTLSFAASTDMTVLQVMASFFLCPEMKTIQFPEMDSFNPKWGFKLYKQDVIDTVETSLRPFDQTPEARLPQASNESLRGFQQRRAKQCQTKRNYAVDQFANRLVSQWPCKSPVLPINPSNFRWEEYMITADAMKAVQVIYELRYANLELYNYLRDISSFLPRGVALTAMPNSVPRSIPESVQRTQGFISGDEIFQHDSTTQIIIGRTAPRIHITSKVHDQPSLLPSLLSRLDVEADSAFEEKYMEDLRSSFAVLQDRRKVDEIILDPHDLQDELTSRREYCSVVVEKMYCDLVAMVTKNVKDRRSMHTQKTNSTGLGPHCPRLSPSFFLRRLARQEWIKLSTGWKDLLVQYGIAITQLQQADRLSDAVSNSPALMKELENTGHQNWDPREYPESLLLEIESGIMIREVQEEIAAQMRMPSSGTNAVMQLNMGEGKSSVIVPIVAAALADASRLVRVIVAKPQSKQMHQMLVSKLGGLLNRKIFQAPFSRAIKLQEPGAEAIYSLFKECMDSGGILLVQPEHILSFMLMGIESALNSKPDMSKTLIRTQEFLDTNARDIVDESDENFSVKFELVYTIGLQRPVEHSPDRWLCIQQVLNIFKKVLSEVKDQFPLSVEIQPQLPGRFPRTRLLRPDAQAYILSRIATQICETGLKGFPIAKQPEEVRKAAIVYITESDPSPAAIRIIENDSAEGIWVRYRKTLLLLRGLIAGGILAFCFKQKRWRVDYGLDANRKPETKLVVPFRAKDNPTPRSEFSHPDVVIVLTSLSYYYYGLNDDEIALSFKHLLKADQAEQEYQAWVRDTSELPEPYKYLVGINMEDRLQCEKEIFPHFRYSMSTINYYLAHIVFTKEMKEFPHKLSASGWDIGKTKMQHTTGFSGTNDSRSMLPLSVSQLELHQQKHTNALVLDYLLHSENSVRLMPRQWDVEITNAEILINMVKDMDPDVRVILDVGAQILELDNLGVARKWLSCIPDNERTEAVVFFDNKDELTVLDRRGHIEALQVSPYASQLDRCLVFLDEAHTRGTDLKLPQCYRAAVTLGANLTKDRLVQGMVEIHGLPLSQAHTDYIAACMRMRLLGKGQSVVFCVPDEIAQKIHERKPKLQPAEDSDISISDILAWVITETWDDSKRNILLWAAQGRRFEQHQKLWAQCRINGTASLTLETAKAFLEDEARSLEDRYRPLPQATMEDRGRNEEANKINLRCLQFKNIKLSAAALSEEQERELSPEIEEEREDQRPPPTTPAKHRIHRDVLKFVEEGTLVQGSKGYMLAFQSLQTTSVSSFFNLAQFTGELLATADFARSVELKDSSDILDSYQRSVQWILTGSNIKGGQVKHMMIISPYEAQELYPEIQKSDYAALHLYAPRPNLGYRPLDKLDLYTIPRKLADRTIPHSLVVELNLFAGQLYLDSFDEYIEVCRFLGLAWEPAKEGEVLAPDGFVLRDSNGKVGGQSGFHQSPIQFLKILLTKIRRNCQDIDKTHMGQILDNQLLMPENFD
ncbi:hypothetical protein F5Y19DRAFT_492813 [Xylariaceae sp. FL1651]|nr:hypothetical protein F5Y19DRAFT_492813 [Xylariaceae sp. FL1651]